MGIIGRVSATAALAGCGLVIGLVAPASAATTTQLSAKSTVNIRAAKSTSSVRLGALDKGQTVTALGTSSGWTTIRFAGKRAYIASAYLSKRKTIKVSTKVSAGSVRTATSGLNVRKGAGTSYAITGSVTDGGTVTMTGKTSKGFGQIVRGTSTGWASLKYLARVNGVPPAVVGTRVATADLNIRTSSASSARTITVVKRGTDLAITGVVANARAQVIYKRVPRWVTAKYLATKAGVPAPPSPPPPGLPAITGTRYATTALNIRSSSADDYTLIAEVPTGTALSITGVVENARMQIIYENAVRWVTAQYLSENQPSATLPPGAAAVEKGLTPNAIKVHRAMLVEFPQITTYYGVRPDPIPDHPSGRALDCMIPNYKSASGKALGQTVAEWARANAKDLGIQYIIWNQHIWNIQRDSEGWRYMADRGGDSANHKNHVHVTVYG